MSAPRIPRLGAAEEARRVRQACAIEAPREEPSPWTLDNLSVAIGVVVMLGMVVWAGPLARFIEELTQ